MDSDRLYASAQRFAGLALRDFAEDRYDMAVLHAGVMLEHLAKAYLTRVHPSLIVETGNFDSLLLACGHGKLAVSPGTLRTIGLSEAVKRLAQIFPGFPYRKPQEQLKPLVDARNGVAHAAMWDRSSSERTVVLAVRAAQPVIEVMGHDEASFWGDYHDTVDLMIVDHVGDVERRVSLLIAAAAQRFDDRYRELAPELREPLLSAIESVLPMDLDPDRSARVNCPACARLGYIDGENEVEWGWDEDGRLTNNDGHPYIRPTHLLLYPNSFYCPVCRLKLETVELIDAAGLGASITLREATEGDGGGYFLHEES
jgi:hypothetical protein